MRKRPQGASLTLLVFRVVGEEGPPDTDDSHPHCALSLHCGLSSVDKLPVSDSNTTGAAGKHRGSALQRNTAGLCSALTTICYFSPTLDTRNETCAHADPGQDPGVISRFWAVPQNIGPAMNDFLFVHSSESNTFISVVWITFSTWGALWGDFAEH